MKRVFKIDERVWYFEDHEHGWGRIGLVNGDDNYGEYICCDANGDILTIIKDSGSEIECVPSNVFQIAPNRTFFGEPVVWEHTEEIDYPYYCPARDENCYNVEVEWK